MFLEYILRVQAADFLILNVIVTRNVGFVDAFDI